MKKIYSIIEGVIYTDSALVFASWFIPTCVFGLISLFWLIDKFNVVISAVFDRAYTPMF